MDAKTVLILGATSDIARAVARRYAAPGRRLQLAGRDADELARLAADLRIRGDCDVSCHVFDALDLAAHAGLLAGLDPFPDTVICAVGMMADQAACEADPALADRVIRTNLNGPAHILALVAARFAAAGGGTIIGISSVAGDRGRGSNATYGAAKAGFTAFLSGLRNRLCRRGVHVMTVKPGFVRTRMTAGMALPPALTASPEQVAAAIYRAQVRRRDTIYVKPAWRPIMAVIRHIPEPLFKRLSL